MELKLAVWTVPLIVLCLVTFSHLSALSEVPLICGDDLCYVTESDIPQDSMRFFSMIIMRLGVFVVPLSFDLKDSTSYAVAVFATIFMVI